MVCMMVARTAEHWAVNSVARMENRSAVKLAENLVVLKALKWAAHSAECWAELTVSMTADLMAAQTVGSTETTWVGSLVATMV